MVNYIYLVRQTPFSFSVELNLLHGLTLALSCQGAALASALCKSLVSVLSPSQV